jgi:hypothetical protein
MKKISIKIVLILVTALFLAAACNEDYIIFNSSMNLVGFSNSALSVNENQGSASPVQIYFGATAGAPATTITLSVDTSGLGKVAAKEGIDFTLSSKSISVEEGLTSVNVIPVDNNIFTGNKKFYLKITSSSSSLISSQNRVLVTIADDEHPLKSWIGKYTVAAVSYGNPGAWDEAWIITTSAVEGHLDQLMVTGLGNGSTEPLIATIDQSTMTISIESGQELGEAYGSGNGAVSLYYGTDAIIGQVMSQESVTSEMLAAASKVRIEGTISSDGSVHLDKMAMVLTDYDWCWDVFNTSWQKQ